MATAPMNGEEPKTPPIVEELSPLEDPLNPLALSSRRVTAPFVDLLNPTDSILRTKGEGDNLKIYRELLRDDQVSAAWGQRRLALTSCDTIVEPGADDAQSKAAAEALQEELDGLNWDDVTDKALFAVFYGWGVAEIMWRPNGSRVSFDSIRVRDRSRFRFDRQRSLYLWHSQLGGWTQMPDRKFWCVSTGADHHDEPYGLGLAHQLYWPVFFKRNDIKFWLIFLEKFGQPTATAKLPPGAMQDATQRTAALAMLRQIATDAGVLVPDNVTVELLEAARSGAADYESLHKVMNEAISKIIIGQTMTTDNGSSRSQAEVHAGVAQKIVEADADLLCASFNMGPVRWWCEWNFPGAVPPRVYRKTEPAVDMNAIADLDTKIKGLGWNPTEQRIREVYGDGYEKAEVPAALAGFQGQPQPGQPSDQPEFAERGEPAALQALRAARRGDQQALVDAAAAFAEQYETIMGRRVGELLQAAEFSDDPDLFRRRLDELLAEAPAPEAMQAAARAGFVSRLFGIMRAQRRA